MAEGLNRVLLLGNLGSDPELRTTAGGTAVLKFRLATSEKYKDQNNAWQERTEWHRIVVWGKRGEALHRFLRKGTRLFVEGSLRTSSYEDKDGQKKYSTEIVAQNVLFADSGRGGEESAGSYAPRDQGGGGYRGDRGDRGGPPREQAAPPAGRDAGPADDYGYSGGSDDDLPF